MTLNWALRNLTATAEAISLVPRTTASGCAELEKKAANFDALMPSPPQNFYGVGGISRPCLWEASRSRAREKHAQKGKKGPANGYFRAHFVEIAQDVVGLYTSSVGNSSSRLDR